MKIGLFAIAGILPGKHSLKDSRLDEIQRLSRSKNKTYAQVELVAEEAVLEAEIILAAEDARTDLILRDLEFLETRLSRCEDEKEKALIEKLKSILEKEEFIFKADLSQEETQAISGYGLLSKRSVVLATAQELNSPDELLRRAVRESGYISFLTAAEKEARACLIKEGSCAWEAAGLIHSDIQKGFIRAEIISSSDFIRAGGEAAAKQLGLMRLEPKEYIMQDGDWVNFRFNK
jgi:hypothetical protein